MRSPPAHSDSRSEWIDKQICFGEKLAIWFINSDSTADVSRWWSGLYRTRTASAHSVVIPCNPLKVQNFERHRSKITMNWIELKKMNHLCESNQIKIFFFKLGCTSFQELMVHITVANILYTRVTRPKENSKPCSCFVINEYYKTQQSK